MATTLGIEPRLRGSEPLVLPLHHIVVMFGAPGSSEGTSDVRTVHDAARCSPRAYLAYPERIELPTFRLTDERSNQLS